MLKIETKERVLKALFGDRYYRLYDDDVRWQGTIRENMYSECWEVDIEIDFNDDESVDVYVKNIEDKVMSSMLELQTYLIMKLRQHCCPTMDVTRESVLSSTPEALKMEKHRFTFEK